MSGPKNDSANGLVRQLWQFCNVLRDDGLSYPDYVEQLTYLLFLKMLEERQDKLVSAKYSWASLVNLDAPAMSVKYSQILHYLSGRPGILGFIFTNARNKIRDPAKLQLLIHDLIGSTQWSLLSADVKGDAYEGLLEKNARDTKSGAGQYFTPRPLVDAIVACVDVKPGESICDPACGTGGFLLAAHSHVEGVRARQARRRTTRQTEYLGFEIVEEVARLAAMNLLLHGMADESDLDVPIRRADSLAEVPERLVDVVLTNPPFGIKGTISYTAEDGGMSPLNDNLTIRRADFWVRTANKQLNFLQHTVSLLKKTGRAAVVVPDNVLYDAGPGVEIRRRLLEEHGLHTILRLPGGLFYAHGVKANVLFFGNQKRGTQGKSELLWVYDLRSEIKRSLKSKPLVAADLEEFVTVYKPGAPADRQLEDETPRWRPFKRSDLLADSKANLDLTWNAGVEQASEESSSGLERLAELSELIAEDLVAAMQHVELAARPPQ